MVKSAARNKFAAGLILSALLLASPLPFAAGATAAAAEPAGENICEFCDMVNCTMGCKGEAVDPEGRKLMVMPGLPKWLFYASVAAILLLSFVVAEIAVRRQIVEGSGWRFNLLRAGWLKALVKKPYFQFMLQAPMTIAFLAIIYFGLFGHQVINIAPTATWTIWWAGLICLVMIAGKTWCLICPWDFIATSIARLRFFGSGPAPLNLGLKWPKFLHNIGLAIGLFILLTWFELGYHITNSPRMTAYLALGMVVMTLVPHMLFARKGFCRHGCFVGRISGLYACFAPVELRAADKSVCARCRTRDCFRGNETGNPCPTSLCLATLEDNTYCLKCSECVRSCPHDNVAINLRPFAADLCNYAGPRLDEAILAIVLLAMTSFHGLTMTPLWENVTAPAGTVIGWISSTLHVGRLTAFTLGMAGVLLAPILIYLAFCEIALRLAKWLDVDHPPSFGRIFIQFSYSVLPIALFYHVAHNGMHIFMEGQNLFTLISDPMGRGWDLFGTAKKTYPPLLSADTIWILQVLLVLTGHIYGIMISQRTARRLFGTGRAATVTQIPLLLAMITFSFVSLWLMQLDMNMSGTLM